jgi:protease-4
MSKADIDAVGRGRVWTGQEAFDRHLVDHLGGLRDALAEARRVAGLPEDAPIEELPHESASLLQLALDAVGVSADERAAAALQTLPPAVQNLARSLAPLVIYDHDEALARMEYVEDF